jgi:hypothetical protein
MIKLLILLAVAMVVPVFFVLTWLISSYNWLMALRNRFTYAAKELDAQLQRRNQLLQANAESDRLADELASTEQKISSARQTYNDAAKLYNARRQTIPGRWIASLFGFGPPPILD